jgi:hypothetical protein
VCDRPPRRLRQADADREARSSRRLARRTSQASIACFVERFDADELASLSVLLERLPGVEPENGDGASLAL